MQLGLWPRSQDVAKELLAIDEGAGGLAGAFGEPCHVATRSRLRQLGGIEQFDQHGAHPHDFTTSVAKARTRTKRRQAYGFILAKLPNGGNPIGAGV